MTQQFDTRVSLSSIEWCSTYQAFHSISSVYLSEELIPTKINNDDYLIVHEVIEENTTTAATSEGIVFVQKLKNHRYEQCLCLR